MAGKAGKQAQEAAPAPQPVAVTFTLEEMAYYEDLKEKLLTLDHVRSILIGNNDSPTFVGQIESLRNIMVEWINQFRVNKQAQYAPKMPEAAAAPGGEDEDEDDDTGGETEVRK